MNIIAEFGCNWNTISDFRSMILFCREMGIKYVKMQLFKPYEVPEEVRRMYIGKGRAKYLFKFAKSHGIELFYTPMYPTAVDICEEIGVNYYKVRYKDNRNLKLYRKIKKTKKPIFVSCDSFGIMGTVYDNLFIYEGLKRVIPLYCVPHYPASFEEYKTKGHIVVGYSDHTPDFKLYNTVKEWAEWIEMHVCLDKKKCYEGKWSKELRKLKEVI